MNTNRISSSIKSSMKINMLKISIALDRFGIQTATHLIFFIDYLSKTDWMQKIVKMEEDELMYKIFLFIWKLSIGLTMLSFATYMFFGYMNNIETANEYRGLTILYIFVTVVYSVYIYNNKYRKSRK